MKNMNSVTGTAIICLVVCFAGLFMADTVVAKPGHDFTEQECAVCHENWTGGSSAEKVLPGVEVSSKCVNCHTSCDVWRRHNDKVVASDRMVNVLPLSLEGRIGCVTCHDPHVDRYAGDAGAYFRYLRLNNLKRELCLNCHRPNDGLKEQVEVVIPAEKIVTHEDHIPLLGRSGSVDIDYLQVTINNASFPLRVRDGIFHTRLRLDEGVNKIAIAVEGKTLWRGKVVHEVPLGGLEENSGENYFAHQTDSLSGCLECHSSQEGLFIASTDPAPDLCYRCHDPLNEKRFLHGPLAVGACLSCHDPHGGVGRSHLKSAELDLCLSCHESKDMADHSGWSEILDEGSCSSCHDPHQSDTRFLTRSAKL